MNGDLLAFLPPEYNFETKSILRKTIKANRYLAELKGVCETIPNQNIIINTLTLQEAKDSSAVENIITTHDELFKEELFADSLSNRAAKEVKKYRIALQKGVSLLNENNLITTNMIITIQEQLEESRSGLRKLSGTELKNSVNGKTVYTPPQNYGEIQELMDNLENFINDHSLLKIDPLIKMAIIHYQFESIHPFYDGNGRTGRIINILYLIQQRLLNIPVLYLSRYIIKNKSEYYRLLQSVRDEKNWEDWVLYMLDGVEKMSVETIRLIKEIKSLMLDYKHRIRENYKFYSQDLLNTLFYHPYTKIDFLVDNLRISRQTASKYLEELDEGGFLEKEKIGKFNYYINTPLFNIFRKI